MWNSCITTDFRSCTWLWMYTLLFLRESHSFHSGGTSSRCQRYWWEHTDRRNCSLESLCSATSGTNNRVFNTFWILLFSFLNYICIWKSWVEHDTACQTGNTEQQKLKHDSSCLLSCLGLSSSFRSPVFEENWRNLLSFKGCYLLVSWSEIHGSLVTLSR